MTKQKTMMMFTYGILKYRQNLLDEGALSIVEKSTIEGHELFLYNNSFPITRKTKNKSSVVYGTLFEIPKSVVLDEYDYVEGYNPKRPYNDNMYNREKVIVTTPNGEKVEAEMYYANPLHFDGWYNKATIIKSGNFDDKHLAKTWAQRKGRIGYYR